MAELPSITLHCSARPGDALYAHQHTLRNFASLQTVDLTDDDKDGPAVMLDKAKALELASWLFAWAHRA